MSCTAKLTANAHNGTHCVRPTAQMGNAYTATSPSIVREDMHLYFSETPESVFSFVTDSLQDLHHPGGAIYSPATQSAQMHTITSE